MQADDEKFAPLQHRVNPLQRLGKPVDRDFIDNVVLKDDAASYFLCADPNEVDDTLRYLLNWMPENPDVADKTRHARVIAYMMFLNHEKPLVVAHLNTSCLGDEWAKRSALEHTLFQLLPVDVLGLCQQSPRWEIDQPEASFSLRSDFPKHTQTQIQKYDQNILKSANIVNHLSSYVSGLRAVKDRWVACATGKRELSDGERYRCEATPRLIEQEVVAALTKEVKIHQQPQPSADQRQSTCILS